MNDEVDPELLATIHTVLAPFLRSAKAHGPLPSLHSEEFLTAPPVVQVAVLLAGGSAWAFAAEQADAWLDENSVGGQRHRQHQLPLISELQRRRFPPHGDVDEWVKHGIGGPPADLEAVA